MSDYTYDEQILWQRVTQCVPAYEGASISYKRGAQELLKGSADTLAARELQFLQERSSHAVRNNGYAQIALNRWKTNCNHIKVVWKLPNGKLHKDMQKYWDEFCENPSHDGHGDMKVLQGVSNSSIFITGNSHIRKLIQREGNTNTVPLKLQLIPSILHDASYSSTQGVASPGDVIRYGITFRNSLPKTYWYRKSDLESSIPDYNVAHIGVPSTEIVHTFIRQEPGQWLGIPLLAPVLLSLYDLDELLDATINKQKAAQAISMIVESANNVASMLPVGAVKTNKDESGKDKIHFQAQGGNVQYTNKGESVKWFQGGDIGANFGTLAEIELRRIAATLDLAYHELTGDAGALNFSSLVGLAIQSRNRLEYLHNFLFIPLREKPIAEAFKALAVIYNSKCSSAKPYFQLPPWRGADELKDAQADLLELQSGLGLYTDKLAERGISVEDVIADRETVKQLEKYGIILNNSASNPSMAQAGNIEANSNSTST